MAQNIAISLTNRKAGQDDLGSLNGVQGIDFDSLNYDNKKITMSGDLQPTFVTSGGRGGYYGITLVQDATGNRVVNWAFSNITWAGTAPQPSAAPNSITNFLVYYDGAGFQGLS